MINLLFKMSKSTNYNYDNTIDIQTTFIPPFPLSVKDSKNIIKNLNIKLDNILNQKKLKLSKIIVVYMICIILFQSAFNLDLLRSRF